MGNYTGRSGLKTGTAGDDFETEHETHGITVEVGTGIDSAGGTLRLENNENDDFTDVGMSRILGHVRDETPKGFDSFELEGNESTLRLSNQVFSSKNIEVFLNGEKLSNEGIRPDYDISGNTLKFTSFLLLDATSLDGVTDNGDTILDENGRGIVLEDVDSSPSAGGFVAYDGLTIDVPAFVIFTIPDNTAGTSTSLLTSPRNYALEDGVAVISDDPISSDFASSLVVLEDQIPSIQISFIEKFGANIASAGKPSSNTLVNCAENHNFSEGANITISGVVFDSIDLNGDFVVKQVSNARSFQIQIDETGAEGPHVGNVGFVREAGLQNKLKLEHFGVLVKYS